MLLITALSSPSHSLPLPPISAGRGLPGIAKDAVALSASLWNNGVTLCHHSCATGPPGILVKALNLIHSEFYLFIYFNLSFIYLFIYLLYIVLVLPYIDMNPLWVYMCSPS